MRDGPKIYLKQRENNLVAFLFALGVSQPSLKKEVRLKPFQGQFHFKGCMAKDPAILFYTSDFLTGTVLMSHEQVGIYIRLICIMHQHGGQIDLDAFNAFIGTNEIIRKKFRFEGDVVYHTRLSEEMGKRSIWTKSRLNNLKKSHMAPHMGQHMDSHMENEDENEIVIRNKVFIQPTIEEVKNYCVERKNNVDSQKWHDFYTCKGWMVGKNKMKDWKAAVRTWENKEGKAVDNTPRKKADKNCKNCGGDGYVYAPGSGKNVSCFCTKG